MCLAIPMKIEKIIDKDFAEASIDGVSRKVCISILEDPAVNDYILIHAGLGIEKLNTDEAEETLNYLRQMYMEEPK
jgi:hydrogenase expression/formation protein HypC